MKLVDERTPASVRAAAVLMGIDAILRFLIRVAGDERWPGRFESRWWPWPQALGLVVGLIFAWLVARLNGLAYWYTILVSGFGLAALIVIWVAAAFGRQILPPVVATSWAAWLESLLLLAIFILLVRRSSIRAPWAISNGFSRP